MKKYSLHWFLLFCLYHTTSFAGYFTLESPAFKLNTMIPAQYTCNGADQSPPLNWRAAPPKTQSFALVVEDPDAPSGTWTHWVLFNIPPNILKLDAGSPVPAGAMSAKNSWGSLNYRGPCPPFGAHRYIFKLYAMDNVLSLGVEQEPDTVLQAMTGHVLDSTELIGLYQKE